MLVDEKGVLHLPPPLHNVYVYVHVCVCLSREAEWELGTAALHRAYRRRNLK